MQYDEELNRNKTARLTKLATEAVFTLAGWCLIIGSFRVAGEAHNSTVLIVVAYFLELAMIARIWVLCFIQLQFKAVTSSRTLKGKFVKESVVAVLIYAPLTLVVIPSLRNAIKTFIGN